MKQAKMIGVKANESKLTKEYLDADTIIIATTFRLTGMIHSTQPILIFFMEVAI